MIFRHVRAVACLAIVLGLVGLFATMSAPVASADELVTYSYAGNNFNEFDGQAAIDTTFTTCPERCSISGSFTLSAPLTYPADADNFDVNPNTYSFTDGAVTFTPLNSSIRVFEVGVNSAGAIDVWQIVLDNILPSGQCEQLNTSGLNGPFDASTIYGDSNCSGLVPPERLESSEIDGDQGTWKSVGFVLPPCGVTIPGGPTGGDCTPGSGSGGSGSGGAGGGDGSTPMPEPGSLTLVGAGLIGGALVSLLRRC